MNERLTRALELKLSGLTYAAIGKQLGLSRQRVQQMLRPPKAIYELIRERARYRCEKCGLKTRSGHVHHQKLTEDWNDIPNLRYLCLKCHFYEDGLHSRPRRYAPHPPRKIGNARL